MSKPFESLSDEAKSARLLDFVQGRLSAQEEDAIEAAIAGDEKLIEELAYYRGLSNAAEPASAPADHEFGWARLSKAIAEDTASAPEQMPAANDNGRVWKIATLAFGLIALVQAGFLFNTPAIAPTDDPIYVPVAETQKLEVRIIFADDATSADISALLNQVEGEIVAGPSAIGLYDVRFDSEASKASGLKALRRADSIVDSATHK